MTAHAPYVGRLSGKGTIPDQADIILEQHLKPKELPVAPDELAALIGDGNARVVVSLEMKDSDYGTGFGAHVSVALTCDQSERGVEMAVVAAEELARGALGDMFIAAKAVFTGRDTLQVEARTKPEEPPRQRPPRRGGRGRGGDRGRDRGRGGRG